MWSIISNTTAFASHVEQMVEDAYHAALTFEDSLLLLDRYFLTVSALEKLKSLNSSGDVELHYYKRSELEDQ